MRFNFEKESEFSFEDLFFSRTNEKGIIKSGNSVFQRVSKYSWNELLEKPHSLIRHPAMPRGVFHLLWDSILSGKPIGAYVVNQAKDKSYYWVFALVSPIKNGFLSIRLKPSSPIFQIVKAKYAELLLEEESKKLSPEDSHALLLKVIDGLNFKNYHHFMTEALTQELECRQKALKLPSVKVIDQVREVIQLSSLLRKKCEIIIKAYEASILVPLNLEVQAARIGQEAAPIAVVSSQYEGLSKQIQDETRKFMEAGNLVEKKVEECHFDICNSLLQKEMFFFFKNEAKETPINLALEMELLEQLSNQGIEKSKRSITEIEVEFSKFKAVSDEVRKLATGLEIVSVTGKIEAAKIKQQSGELLGLLSDLANFKASLKSSLKEIENIGKDLSAHTHELQGQLA